MKRKAKPPVPVDFGENGGVAGYNLSPMTPSNRASSPMTSHEQLERINTQTVTGFRWDVRFDGV